MVEKDARELAWWFRDGRWYQKADPVDWDADNADPATAAGYLPFYRREGVAFESNYLTVRHRPGDDTWLVQFGPTAVDAYAPTMPDMMVLLKEWSQILANLESGAEAILAAFAQVGTESYCSDAAHAGLVQLGAAIAGAIKKEAPSDHLG